MASEIELEIGAEVDNQRLCELFGCGPQGGMRRSHKTGTLVIISNHVESIYDDRWIDGVLHYTGMGQKGDQTLAGNQNKTLAESATNGVAIHLFEVHRPQLYTYDGEVQLAGAPYQETQVDAEGAGRLVWVFPLAPRSGEVPAVRLDVARELIRRKERAARRLSDEEVAERAKRSGRQLVGTQATTVKQHQRSVWVAEHAKRRAAGRCELCGSDAPFKDLGGKPYLETHHIVWLARGGADMIENTVALCPNCHKRMHILEDPNDIARLGHSTRFTG